MPGGTADGAPLAASFYARPVVEVARDLVGCVLEHAGVAGVIVESEAYHESEPACHAYAGLTPRTRTLFGPPGRAYVYRSYGIHALFNAVCEPEGVGAAVLVRALEPLAGIEEMRARRGPAPLAAGADGSRPAAANGSRRSAGGRVRAASAAGARVAADRELCSGPGKLTQALAIELEHNDRPLQRGALIIRARPAAWPAPEILDGTRIGITKGVELRWRFCIASNPHVSRPRPRADLLDAGP
jgi:DNA-3-methyladenine glycosylase